MCSGDQTSSNNKNKKNEERVVVACSSRFHPTSVLPILTMIDSFSVALVVPLLQQYYVKAGVTSASQRELLSSLFSFSQITGSLIMAALNDSGFLTPNFILYVSFLGSSLSYLMIVYGGMTPLICSRVIVGLVKQTMTVSTSMVAMYTTHHDRTRCMGRLTATSTLAFIIGPSVGAYLYKYVDYRAPALLASILFVVNFVLALILLPSSHTKSTMEEIDKAREEKMVLASSQKRNSKISSFLSNLKSCFTSNNKALASIIISILIFDFTTRATSYASMTSYYEEMFGIETYQRGYISSYQRLISFLFQSFFIQYSLRICKGEIQAACFASTLIIIATILEYTSSFKLFIMIICPIISISTSLLSLSLRCLLTQYSPKQSLSSVLASLDVLQNATLVTVPFYRSLLFRLLSWMNHGKEDVYAAVRGDPNPYQWILSSVVHWIVATLSIIYLLKKRMSIHPKLE